MPKRTGLGEFLAVNLKHGLGIRSLPPSLRIPLAGDYFPPFPLLGAEKGAAGAAVSYPQQPPVPCLNKYGSILIDIPFVDQSFYGKEVYDYHEELRHVGVMSEFKDACEYIGNHLMSIAVSSALTRAHFYSILSFIRFLRDKLLPPDGFINSIKKNGCGLHKAKGAPGNPCFTTRNGKSPLIAQIISEVLRLNCNSLFFFGLEKTLKMTTKTN
ncbi:C4-dicarboxylate transport protein [Striga asiatica]|uniref:C4-dicarboxylate transport protein n=1 Tax=Striga asiatica TaxID=4170 RepID=A0A5A7PW98_STRAF|nr:C4-dicarboxylate transport protein [Striga asiatica]